MKIRYIPGVRPTPMLMYYVQPEEKVYNEMLNDGATLFKKGSYTTKMNHIWNMNAYIIYNNETFNIESVVINNFSNFVYLLRNMNKPLYIELNDKEYNILKTDIEDIFKDEFEVL